MGIAPTTETIAGGGDYRWLASARGTDHPKSATADVSAFTIANGVIPSGTPVKVSGTKFVPADATSSDATLAGFVYHDFAATTAGADQTFALLTDATIDASFVPGTHDLTDGRYICDIIIGGES